jgi:NitT/TauT family transport system permease protein
VPQKSDNIRNGEKRLLSKVPVSKASSADIDPRSVANQAATLGTIVAVSEGQSERRRRLRFSRARKRRKLVILTSLQLATFVVLIFLWQFTVQAGWFSEFEVSKPTAVFDILRTLVTSHFFYTAVWTTTTEILSGLVIGSVLGVAVGILLAGKPYVYRVASPLIATLYTLPRIALVSLFIMWFGLGVQSKIVLVVSLVFFSMLFNTYSGVRNIERRLVHNVRLMGGSRRTLTREVYLPGIMPWIFSGLRISLVFAVTGAVVGEMLGSYKGLGFLLAQYQNAYVSAGVFAMIVVIAVFAMLLSWILAQVERRLVRWNSSGTSER